MTTGTQEAVLPDGAALETHALTGHVRRRDVRAFFRTFSARNPGLTGSTLDRVRRVAIRIGATAVLVGGLAMAFGMSEEIREGADDLVEQLVGMSVVMGLLVLGGGILWWWTIRTSHRRGTPRRHYRLARFAADNGMRYLPSPVRGTHLRPWSERGLLTVSRVLRMPSPDGPVEFGNYELAYATTSNGQAQFGGYCALRLDRKLPNIVVRAVRRRNVVTEAGLPARAQHLSLEGDFDRHFRLYCPEGYERDALYLFTPDVMARLIDRAGGFDVEIVDDWVFLSRAEDVVTLDPRRWRTVVAAAGALRGKIAQWERWHDDRQSADGASDPEVRVIHDDVAAPGRRLRPGSAANWVILGVCAAVLLTIFLLSLL